MYLVALHSYLRFSFVFITNIFPLQLEKCVCALHNTAHALGSSVDFTVFSKHSATDAVDTRVCYVHPSNGISLHGPRERERVSEMQSIVIFLSVETNAVNIKYQCEITIDLLLFVIVRDVSLHTLNGLQVD